MRTSMLVLAVLLAAGCKKKPPEQVVVPEPAPPPVAQATRPEPAPVPAPAVPAPVDFATVYFDYDKSTLRPDAKEVLAADLGVLQDNPALHVTIEGHCDERGTTEYNLALGERRAVAVEQYLVTAGIAPSRLDTLSYGEERPVDLGHDEAAWARNRRVEFHVPGGTAPMAER